MAQGYRARRIPVNVTDSGRCFNGLFRTRNLIEGLLLAAVPGLLVWNLFNPDAITLKIQVTTVVVGIPLIAGVFGVPPYSLVEFITLFAKYQKGKHYAKYNPRLKWETTPDFLFHGLEEPFAKQIMNAIDLLRMFFDFAETKMTDDQLHEWVEKRFPNTTTYYPSALTNAATQYLVDSIIASTMNPDDAQPEQTNKQVYILYEETPDCMGSGSTSREVAKTTSFPQALEMLKKGTGNTLVKRTRINGTLVETYWNEFSRQFE